MTFEPRLNNFMISAEVQVDQRKKFTEEIHNALNKYKLSKSTPAQPSGAHQRKEARAVIKLSNKLHECIRSIGPETYRWLSHAPVPTKALEQLHFESGEERLEVFLEYFDRAAAYALGQAALRKGRGKKKADPALVELVIELASIWERGTGRPFKAYRKDHRKSQDDKKMLSRRFVSLVLDDALGLNLTPERLSHLLTTARQELGRRRETSQPYAFHHGQTI